MLTIALLLTAVVQAASEPASPETGVSIESPFVRMEVSPGRGGAVTALIYRGTGHNQAGDAGLLQEGFGVGSFYVPNRRLNETLEATGPRTVRYSYDCDGPNIRGLHVTRIMTLAEDAARLKVAWTVENRGEEDTWLAPWVRNDAAPGGSLDDGDRLDVPTLAGVIEAKHNAYRAASRNWAAVTDPAASESLCAVFHADQLHSFLVLRDDDACAFQASFVPTLLQKGSAWSTTYTLSIVRGLTHVDFADSATAVQLDLTEGPLRVSLGSAEARSEVVMRASVRGRDGAVWQLPGRRFGLAPNRVVRCPYEWSAPEDGAYEFLAELSQGSDQLFLGEESGSPHGGIDTQFLVGKPAPAPMEAWTEAPYMLQRGPRELPRPLAANTDGVAIWYESSLEKVFRADRVVPKGPVSPTRELALARNEAESFQVVLRPPEGRDLHQITFRVSNLTDPKTGAVLSAANIELFNVAYHSVQVPTHFEGPTGDCPDALPPYAPFTAQGGEASPIWVTVHAPADTAPGRYVGMMELTSVELEPLELWLAVTVYDFELPITPALKTDFGFWSAGAYAWCKRLGYQGSEEELNAAFLRNALRHRVTLRELAQFPSESADYARDLRAYASRLERLRDGGASTLSIPASLLDVPAQLERANAFVVEQGLQGRAFVQLADNPQRAAWPRLHERMQQWMDTAPDIPVMVTTYGQEPFLHDAADIWAIHLPVLDTANAQAILDRIREGGEVWCYVNHSPPRQYGNLLMDFAGTEHRALFWQAWALGLRGMHYWCANGATAYEDPWHAQLDITPANGDGFLVYPGKDGPVSSIRWETIRDGIEDYDYLALFHQRLADAREAGASESLLKRAEETARLDSLIPNLVSFSRDAARYEAKRAALAAMIVELGVRPESDASRRAR